MIEFKALCYLHITLLLFNHSSPFQEHGDIFHSLLPCGLIFSPLRTMNWIVCIKHKEFDNLFQHSILEILQFVIVFQTWSTSSTASDEASRTPGGNIFTIKAYWGSMQADLHQEHLEVRREAHHPCCAATRICSFPASWTQSLKEGTVSGLDLD